MLSKAELKRVAEFTAKSGTWVITDNTYEQFQFTNEPHITLNRPNFIHVFSFSKVATSLSFPP